MAITSARDFLESATETFSSVIIVNQTTYNIERHWLKLAANYFNIDDQHVSTDITLDQANDRINLLKAGLFGYFNEIASSEIKNAVFYKNVIYDEHFLNTASFPESIYNFAKLYNVQITNGTPSHMAVQMVMRKSDLLHSPLLTEIEEDQYVQTTTLKTYQLVISREYSFSVGKYKFLLPYDVQILIKQNSGEENDYTITARYLVTNNDFPFANINSPEIKVYQDIQNAEEYIHLQLDIYQLEKTTKEFIITSEDISDNLFYDVEFPNQLANFEVYYEYKGVRSPLKRYFNNTFNPINPNEKYCYFTYVDDKKLQISFSSVANSFRPRLNSKLIVNVYTTRGQEGNFTYNDEILFNFTRNATNNFNRMVIKVYPLSTSSGSASGGKNKLSLTAQKQKIIQAALGRDNLIMERDLEAYFDVVNDVNTVNGSEIKFLRKRDDILQRLYSAFLLLRDEDEKVIPSNTAPWVDIPRKYFEDSNNVYGNQLVIPEHSAFVYDEKSRRYKFHTPGMDAALKADIADKNKLVYVNPFLTKIDTNPTLKASYFKLDIDKDFTTNYTYLNNLVNKSMLINKIHITKSSISDEDLSSDTYEISLNLNSNVNINDLDGIIKIRGKLISANDNSDYGYFEFARERPDTPGYDQSKYVAKLTTDRKFNDKNFLSLANSLYDSDGYAINNQFIDDDLIIKIGVLIKDDNIRSQESNKETNLFIYDKFPYRGRDVPQENIQDYKLALSVATGETVHLYQDLSNIMTSLVTRVYDPEDDWNGDTNKFGNHAMDDQIYHNGDTWVVFNDEIHQVDGDGNFWNTDHTRHFHVIGTDVYEYFDAVIPSDIPNPEKVYDFFRVKGFSAAASSVMMALINYVSGFNPAFTGPNNSYGILGWVNKNDNILGANVSSITHLNDYAKLRHLDKGDIMTQLNYLFYEMTTDTVLSGFARQPELLDDLKNAINEKVATKLLIDNYYPAKNKPFNEQAAQFDEIANDIKSNDLNIRLNTNGAVNDQLKGLHPDPQISYKKYVWNALKEAGFSSDVRATILGAIAVMNPTYKLFDDDLETKGSTELVPQGLLGWTHNKKAQFVKFSNAKSGKTNWKNLPLQTDFLIESIIGDYSPFPTAADLDDFLSGHELNVLAQKFVKTYILSYRNDARDINDLTNTIHKEASDLQTFFSTKGMTGSSEASVNIYKYFAFQGFGDIAIRAIINNMYANSLLHTGATDKGSNAPYGLFAVTDGYKAYLDKNLDTRTRLITYYKNSKQAVDDLATQLEFFYNEITTNKSTSIYAQDPSKLEAFKNMTDLATAVKDFQTKYLENYNSVQNNIDARISDSSQALIDKEKNDLLKAAQGYYKEYNNYGVPQERLFKLINVNKANMDHDYINDDNNMRLNGIIAMVPDGIYVVRSDLTFTTINGKHYIVYNNKKHQGLHIKLDDGSIHKILHDGSIDPKAINDDLIDPATQTIVMFYDYMYNVKDPAGYFTDRRGDRYQITNSGLYKLEHGRRYAVTSALHVDRSKNWYDSQVSMVRPKGLFVVMHDRLYTTDEFGLVVGYKKYHYRAIIAGSYQGLYVITQNESIYKVDMLGMLTANKDYKNDKNFPPLKNIWTNEDPVDPNKPVFPFPNMANYNNGTVDEYNNANNIINKTGYTISDMLNDGLFRDFIPEEQKDFRIELLPLIGLRYFKYQHGQLYIYNVIDYYIYILNTVVRHLENNTTIDLKFYNSYGPSNFWYLSNANDEKLLTGPNDVNADNGVLGTTNYNVNAMNTDTTKDGEDIHRYISRTNFIYDFTIHLFESIDDDTDNTIKSFISDFVEASNANNVIPVSNLMRLLEEKFEVIRYIEFNGLAGKYAEEITNKYQKIKNRAVDFLDMSIQEIREYVPEYMNLRKDLKPNTIQVTDADGNSTTVTLDHMDYDYVINLTYQVN